MKSLRKWIGLTLPIVLLGFTSCSKHFCDAYAENEAKPAVKVNLEMDAQDYFVLEPAS